MKRCVLTVCESCSWCFLSRCYRWCSSENICRSQGTRNTRLGRETAAEDRGEAGEISTLFRSVFTLFKLVKSTFPHAGRSSDLKSSARLRRDRKINASRFQTIVASVDPTDGKAAKAIDF